MTFWSNWTWGQKNYGGFFLIKFLIKKIGIFFIVKGIEETLRRVSNTIKN
jgi:hypothetical protein